MKAIYCSQRRTVIQLKVKIKSQQEREDNKLKCKKSTTKKHLSGCMCSCKDFINLYLRKTVNLLHPRI